MLSTQYSLTKVNGTCECLAETDCRSHEGKGLIVVDHKPHIRFFGDVILMDDIAITLKRPTYRGRVFDAIKKCIDYSREQRFPESVSGHEALVC